jgi:hypothetical protein
MGEPREATAFREKTRVRIGVAGLIWLRGRDLFKNVPAEHCASMSKKSSAERKCSERKPQVSIY